LIGGDSLNCATELRSGIAAVDAELSRVKVPDEEVFPVPSINSTLPATTDLFPLG